MIGRRAFLAAAALLPVAAACAPETGTVLERARRDGALRIGISGERPFCWTDSGGRVTGAQPEVARVVLDRIGVGGVEAVQVTFDRLIPTLLAGQCDLVCAGLAITAERCAQVAFSRPDFVAPPAFLVPEGNPRGLTSFGDAARSGLRLVGIAGAVEPEYARLAGVRDDRLVLVETQRDIVGTVVDGRADVGVGAAISLSDELSRNPGTGLEVTGPLEARTRARRRIPASAFALRHEDADLLTAFDGALAALHAGPEWLAIVEPFGFGPSNVPDRDLATADLCLV